MKQVTASEYTPIKRLREFFNMSGANSVARMLKYVACVAIFLILASCGNKGSLFIDPTELTAEQKELLGQLDDNDVVIVPEETEEQKKAREEAEKKTKKKDNE